MTKRKDATGEYGGGKHRETWMTADLNRLIHRYSDHKSIDDHEPLTP